MQAEAEQGLAEGLEAEDSTDEKDPATVPKSGMATIAGMFPTLFSGLQMSMIALSSPIKYGALDYGHHLLAAGRRDARLWRRGDGRLPRRHQHHRHERRDSRRGYFERHSSSAQLQDLRQAGNVRLAGVHVRAGVHLRHEEAQAALRPGDGRELQHVVHAVRADRVRRDCDFGV